MSKRPRYRARPDYPTIILRDSESSPTGVRLVADVKIPELAPRFVDMMNLLDELPELLGRQIHDHWCESLKGGSCECGLPYTGDVVAALLERLKKFDE